MEINISSRINSGALSQSIAITKNTNTPHRYNYLYDIIELLGLYIPKSLWTFNLDPFSWGFCLLINYTAFIINSFQE